MICLTCNAANDAAARFCSNCGADLGDTIAFGSTTTEQERDPLFGSAIAGKYRVDANLGAGGMGVVYRATRLLIGDEVAIKILHSEKTDPRAAERFRREAQAAARLKHPNAVNVYDFGITDDGLQYLVMELVEGESLGQIIKQQGPLTPSACAEVISQVCAALDEAHRHNIIHRDIKPENIIVNVTAIGLKVKVLDFGIAKLRDDAVRNLTQTGGILGTPHYMSPEQCLGEELDGRSDIYSLGIVLYEMLAGRVPFNSPISTAVVVQHVNQAPPSLREQNLSISPSMEAVVFRALAKQREGRPQTANALAEEFTVALTDPHFTPSPGFAQTDGNADPRVSQGNPTVVMQAPQTIPQGKSRPFYFQPWILGVAGLLLLLPVLYLGFFRAMTNNGGKVTLHPFQEGPKWGYIDSTGKIVVSPQYTSADSFHEGLAQVSIGEYPNQKSGYIEESGKVAISPQFDFAGRFVDGMAKAGLNKKFGLIDRSGAWVIRPLYENVDDFSDGLAVFSERSKCGFIDKRGQVVVPPQFELCGSFKEDLAPIKRNGKYGYISRTGQTIIAPQFESADSFSEGLALVSPSSQRYGFIDKSGNYAISPQFSFARDFSEGLAVAYVGESTASKAGYIDKTGRFVIELRYNSAEKFSEGLAAVSVHNSYGYIDKTGAVVVKLEYDSADQFENGIAQVQLDDKPIYLDKTGKILWRQKPKGGLGDVSPEEKVALVEQMIRDNKISAECIQEDGGPRKVASVDFVDLNNDGVGEFEVVGKGCGCVGARRCQMLYYRKTPNGYELLLDAGPSEASVNKEMTNGYRDIGVAGFAGNDIYGTVFKYIGAKYVASECSESTYVGADRNGDPRFITRRVPCRQ